MAAPIILWNPKLVRGSDDAGNLIVKTILPPPTTSTPPYRAYNPQDWRPTRLVGVPKLAAFCIRVLSQYPDQLYQLGDTRINFDEREGGTDAVLGAILPNWKTPDFSLRRVDPRLWATIIQVYDKPPSILRSYPCELSDPYVPILNQIPPSPDFSLLTVLDLTACAKITDDNIISLKTLHNLAALDLTCCISLTSRAIEMLSRTLVIDEDSRKRGPWALRILRLHKCVHVDKRIFDFLHAFPLLCVVDLRNTSCTPRDIKRPFFSTPDGELFDLPVSEGLNYLSKAHPHVFASASPFTLSLRDRSPPCDIEYLAKRSGVESVHSHHNSFVVLPPSRGSTTSRGKTTTTFQFGNVDTNEFLLKKTELAERRRRLQQREDSNEETYDNGTDFEENWYDDDREDSDRDGLDEDEDDYGISSNGSEEESDDGLDKKLISALRESARRMIEALVATPNEDTTNIQSSPTATAITMRATGVRGAVSTNKFYMPYLYEALLPEPLKASRLCEMALLRVPPTWSTLESIRSASKRSNSAVKCHPKNDDILILGKKRKASINVLRTELTKRRKPGLETSVPDVTLVNHRRLSPLPSPTSTVCDKCEMPIQRNPSLRPISSLRPPPRSSFPGPPRLKLDTKAKFDKSTQARPPSRFSAVRPARKFRNMSLAEGFKTQAQKPAVSIVSGTIRAPGSKYTPVEAGPKDTTKAKVQSVDPQSRGKKVRTQTSAGTGVGGFDWDGWGKG